MLVIGWVSQAYNCYQLPKPPHVLVSITKSQQDHKNHKQKGANYNKWTTEPDDKIQGEDLHGASVSW